VSLSGGRHAPGQVERARDCGDYGDGGSQPRMFQTVLRIPIEKMPG
jgi:hypothetical protein